MLVVAVTFVFDLWYLPSAATYEERWRMMQSAGENWPSRKSTLVRKTGLSCDGNYIFVSVQRILYEGGFYSKSLHISKSRAHDVPLLSIKCSIHPFLNKMSTCWGIRTTLWLEGNTGCWYSFGDTNKHILSNQEIRSCHSQLNYLGKIV